MATIQNVIRGLQVLASYSNSHIETDETRLWAGPDHYVSGAGMIQILHPNEISIMKTNGWEFDDDVGYWTINTT